MLLVAPAVLSAISYDQQFLTVVLADFVTNSDRYALYMKAHGMNYPQTVMQYVVDLNTRTDTDMVLQLADFPFQQFSTYIVAFPWVSGFMLEAGISEFKVPADFTAGESSIVSKAAATAVETTVATTVETTVATATARTSATPSHASTTLSSNSGLRLIPAAVLSPLLLLL